MSGIGTLLIYRDANGGRMKTIRVGIWTLSILLCTASLRATPAGAHRETVAEIMARQRLAGDLFSFPVPRPRRVAPRWNLPGNPSSPARPTFPEAAAAVAPPLPAAPQTLGITFLGAQLSDSNAFPPDTAGAAGPTQFLVGVNGRIRSFNKTTGSADGLLDAGMDTFFSSVRNGNPTSIPRVRYDRISQRWIVTILAAGVSFTNNRVLIAASDAASAGVISNSTVWTYFYFEHDLDSPAGDANLYFDFNTLGIDANALTIGGSLFDTMGVFQGTTVHVVRKSTILTGGGGNLVPSGNVVAFRNLTGTPTGPGPYSPQGVDDFLDTATTNSWIVGVDNASTGTLMFRDVTFSVPGAWPPAGISANLSLTVPTTALPIVVPHQGNAGGSAGLLDAVDDRLGPAVLRGGHVWAVHNIAVNSAGVGDPSGDRDGSRWYEIDVSGGTPTLVQSGTLFDSAATSPTFYWIPSIAVTGQGHAALGTSASGATQHVNAATAGRLAGDAAGTLQTPLLYTASTTSYNPAADPGPPRRWGDYSATGVDPNDDMTLWTIQEYCNTFDSWGVRVAQLIAPPPATPASAAPSSVAGGVPSVDVVITGTSTAGSGFFDPGAGFPNRLQASIPNVTVNSVTFTSPTSTTVNVSTVGSAFGSYAVTVTNPDGQSRTSAAAIFSVIAGGPAPTVSTIAPTSGPAAGGTSVQVTGTNFVAGSTLKIGGVDASGAFVNATRMNGASPALPPGTLDDVTVTLPDSQSATLAAGWFADFLDVPQADIFHSYVEKLIRNGVTVGCGAGLYCRDNPVRRDQMAVFLLKSKLGSGYTPPPCTGTVFDDVPCTGGIFDPWIEDLAGRGITGGCSASPPLYCPSSPVTRGQMAPFLLKADLGSSYSPPACTGTVFDDVPCTGGVFDPWIEDLAARAITAGCSASPPLYCPNAPNTRGQMAVFLVKTFGLP